MCLWTWSHFPVQCTTASRGKTKGTWVEGGDRVQRPDFKKHWRAMWHPGNPSSLRPMGGKLLPHQLPDQTASQVIIMIKLMKPFNKSNFFSNLIQYYGRNGTSGWGVVPDNRWISLLFNFCWFILRPIYYIHIITLFFRDDTTFLFWNVWATELWTIFFCERNSPTFLVRYFWAGWKRGTDLAI